MHPRKETEQKGILPFCSALQENVQKGLTLLYMLHCICHVRSQPKAAFPLRNLCRNPPGKVLASDALAMSIVRHLVSGDSIPNFANVRLGFLFENFAWFVIRGSWGRG